jgi:hypothetical protein
MKVHMNSKTALGVIVGSAMIAVAGGVASANWTGRATTPKVVFHAARDGRLSRATGHAVTRDSIATTETLAGGQITVGPPATNAVAAISQAQASNAVVAEGAFGSLESTNDPVPASIQLANLIDYPNAVNVPLPSGGVLVWVVRYDGITILPMGGIDPRTGRSQASEVSPATGSFFAIVDATTGAVLQNYASGGPSS